MYRGGRKYGQIGSRRREIAQRQKGDEERSERLKGSDKEVEEGGEEARRDRGR